MFALGHPEPAILHRQDICPFVTAPADQANVFEAIL
jgi:hypothetical protein